MHLQILSLLSLLTFSPTTAAFLSDPEPPMDLYRRNLEDALLNYLEAREAYVPLHWYAAATPQEGQHAKRDGYDLEAREPYVPLHWYAAATPQEGSRGKRDAYNLKYPAPVVPLNYNRAASPQETQQGKRDAHDLEFPEPVVPLNYNMAASAQGGGNKRRDAWYDMSYVNGNALKSGGGRTRRDAEGMTIISRDEVGSDGGVEDEDEDEEYDTSPEEAGTRMLGHSLLHWSTMD